MPELGIVLGLILGYFLREWALPQLVAWHHHQR